MWRVLVPASRLLALGGAALSFSIVCLYEDERGKIQNRLEEWWVKLSDRQGHALSGHILFMRGVAEVAVRGFDRLLGQRLLSLQALTVSVGLSGMSTWLFFTIYFSLTMFGEARLIIVVSGLVVTAIGGFMTREAASEREQGSELALLTPVLGRLIALPRTIAVTLSKLETLLFLLMFSVVPLIVMTMGSTMSTGLISNRLPDVVFYTLDFLLVILVLLCSFGCDVGFIAVTRLTLKWCSTAERASRIIAAVFVNSLLGVVLGLGPILLWHKGWRKMMDSVAPQGPVSPNWQQGLQYLGVTLSATNTVDVVVAMTFAFLALTLLAHRLFWPLLMRPTYLLAELGIVRQRKPFWVIGIALLGYAVNLPGWFKVLVGA